MDDAQTVRVIDWDDHNPMAAPSDSGPSFRRWLLDKVPSDVARSFTETQLAAIEYAIEDRSRRHPLIDIRLSVPFIWRRFFVVFLAGPERRSPERLRRERVKHAFWTIANACTVAFVMLFLIPAVIGMIHMINSAF
jgi:hypothetical protein